MNKNNYTSWELSKKLTKSGCQLKSEYKWVCSRDRNYTLEVYEYHLLESKDSYNFDKENMSWFAYDILNDICVKYAKEFFGEDGDYGIICNFSEKEHDKYCDDYDCNKTSWKLGYKYFTPLILELLQRGKKQKAEDYIWEHCLFNKH